MKPAITFAFAALAAGCVSTRMTSELRAWKLPADGSLEWAGKQGTGIPFQMTRTSFVLREVDPTDANGNRGYELGMEAIPDPEQRYAVNLDPGMFSNVTFQTEFDGSGRLTTFNASGQDQFVPLIRSIGSFAAAVVTAGSGIAIRPGMKGAGATDYETTAGDSGTVWTSLVASLEHYMNDHANPILRLRGEFGSPTADERAAGQRLLARMRTYSTANDFTGAYSPIQGEAVWLRALPRAVDDYMRILEQEWADERTDFDDPANRPRRRPVGMSVYLDSLLRDTGLTFGERWERIGDAVDRALVLHRTHEEALRKLGAVARALLEGLAGRDLVVEKVAELASLELSGETWRHRQYAELLQAIELKQQELLAAEQNANLSADPAQLARDLADLNALAMTALGLMPEYKRKRTLETFLSRMPKRTVAIDGMVETSPAAQEYALMRLELDHIKASLASAVASRSRPSPTAPARKRIVQLSEAIDIPHQPSGIERAKAVKLHAEKLKQTDQEFVIVIEPYYATNSTGTED